MKRILPKNFFNPQGFTLIELLVVISIIAILATIGIAVFSGAQAQARDARRKADLASIAKAVETGRSLATVVNVTYSYNNGLAGSDFPKGGLPQDPTRVYCVKVFDTEAGATGQAVPAAWTTTSCTPPAAVGAAVGSDWTSLKASIGLDGDTTCTTNLSAALGSVTRCLKDATDIKSWVMCASTERSGVICEKSLQKSATQ